MNTNTFIESKISLLEHLLTKHKNIWEQEVLSKYLYGKFDNSLTASFEDLQYFEHHGNLPPQHSLHQYSIDLKFAASLPQLLPNTNDHILQKAKNISHKKAHELNALSNLIIHNTFISNHSCNILDLAGGKGVLSHYLLERFPEKFKSSIVIDKNITFKNPLSTHLNVHFKQFDLLQPQLNIITAPHSSIFMLHGCGDLTDQGLTIFKNSNSKFMVAVGCCYHLCTQIINFNSNSQIGITKDALYLATRTNKEVNEKTWNKRINQKHYRYTFEIWYNKKFQTPMPALRSSPTTLYNKNFEDYCVEQFKRLNLPFNTDSLRELTHELIDGKALRNHLIGIGALRLIFARAIEAYLALRRAQKCMSFCENPKLYEIFHKKLSPRNIALVLER